LFIFCFKLLCTIAHKKEVKLKKKTLKNKNNYLTITLYEQIETVKLINTTSDGN